jgi:YVTN family beta-propeller protein
VKSTAFVLLTAAATLTAAAGYHVTGKIQIGGEGGWDYATMDSAGRRLYLSHATRVVVVDPDSGKVVGEIADTAGVHGIAIAPKLNHGYTSNGRSNNVTVFDLKTLKTVGQIATGQNPDAILYEPSTNKVLTFNGRSKDATVIDAATDKVLATIPLGGKPEFAQTDTKGKIYVNIEDTHEVAEIDARNNSVAKRYNLAGCEEPSGLAFDVKNRRLFSVCANKVMVVSDPDSGAVVATVPIGQGADGAGFDVDRGLAFSSNGEGTVTVVRGSGTKYAVAETVQTQRGARTMAVDQKTHKLFLPTAEFGAMPAATDQQPRPRPPIVPGTFMVVVVEQ